MKIKLTQEQIQGLKSMNIYWEEVAKRPEGGLKIAFQELAQATSVIDLFEILLILGEYAKSYKDESN
jgi:hypothetical protein